MFKDLKKGYQVYTLDTSGVPKFFMGTVVNVSEPRFAQSQLGQYQQLQDRVMDLTIEVEEVVTTEEQTPMTRIISGI